MRFTDLLAAATLLAFSLLTLQALRGDEPRRDSLCGKVVQSGAPCCGCGSGGCSCGSGCRCVPGDHCGCGGVCRWSVARTDRWAWRFDLSVGHKPRTSWRFTLGWSR